MNEYHKTSENQLPTAVDRLSTRPSNRLEGQSQQGAQPSAAQQNKGADSIPFPGIPSQAAEATAVNPKSARLSRSQLEQIEAKLSARDHAVLQAIRKYRFLTSEQIGRLYVPSGVSQSSKTRVQNLMLKRLSNFSLIRPLERRIGGSGGGSTVPVWHLTEAGQRLLTLNDPGKHPRKRFKEPSPTFLSHTLAIAECAVQLTCLCRNSSDLTLELLDTEPSCWRRYKDGDRVYYLKPDLYAVTSYDGYEDHWFIEMDLGTESSSQIVEKCNIYLRYYYTGIEQKATGMFPLAIWIVKDAARKESLKAYIRESLRAQPKMFLVITPDELEKMLRQFIDTKELC